MPKVALSPIRVSVTNLLNLSLWSLDLSDFSFSRVSEFLLHPALLLAQNQSKSRNVIICQSANFSVQTAAVFLIKHIP